VGPARQLPREKVKGRGAAGGLVRRSGAEVCGLRCANEKGGRSWAVLADCGLCTCWVSARGDLRE
jgi:hypothetical protein